MSAPAGGPGERGATVAAASLQARVLPPPVLPEHVDRHRPAALLEAALMRPLTLVIAPAGYGKSTLVARWRAASRIPVGWILLTSVERTPASLSRGLVAAARAGGIPIGNSCESLLRLPEPDAGALATRLADDFAALSGAAALVLDDYHRVAGPENDEFLGQLVSIAPPAMRLIVLGRRAPELPYARLRGRGVLTEIGPDLLRFDEAETASFLAGSGFAALSPAAAREVHARTGGWPVAVRLATSSLAWHPSDPSATPRLPDLAAEGDLSRFLLDEVLASMPMPLAEVLRRAAVLRRITPARLAALVPERSPSALAGDLQQLASRYRMLSFDGEQGYRMHDLFREALTAEVMREAGSIDFVEANLRACAACEQEGAILEAIGHAVAAEHPDVALGLIGRHVDAALGQERIAEVATWLSSLPPAWIDASPRALGALIDVETVSGSLLQALEHTTRLLALVRDPGAAPDPPGGPMSVLEAEGYAVRFVTTFFSTEELIARTNRVVAEIPPERASVRADAVLWGAIARQSLGRSGEGLRELRRLEAAPENATPYIAAHIRWAEAAIHVIEGRPADAVEPAERMADAAERGGLAHALSNARVTQGIVALELGHVDDAARCFERALAMQPQCSIYAEMEATFGLALAWQVTGASAEATALAERLAALANDASDDLLGIPADSFAARLAVLQGDVATAERWLRERWSPGALHRISAIELPVMTAVQVMIAGSAKDARSALEVLERWRADPANRHNTSWQVRAEMLEGLAHARLGERSAALSAINRALSAEGSGSIAWPLIEHLPALRALAIRGDSASALLIRRIDRLVPPERGELAGAAAGADETGAGLAHLRSVMGGFELTARELETLALLCTGKSNREIGRVLGIREGTVNIYATNIYRKLGVSNRTAATMLVGERGGFDPAG